MIWPEALIRCVSYTFAPEMGVLLCKGVAEFPVTRHLSPLNRSVTFDDSKKNLVFRNSIPRI